MTNLVRLQPLSGKQFRLSGTTHGAISYVSVPEAPSSLVRGNAALCDIDGRVMIPVKIGAACADMSAL